MTQPTGSENTGEEPTETQEEHLEEAEQRNPDLHGQALEVEEGGDEGQARTPG